MFLLCCNTDCWPGCDDWLIFGLGVIVSIGWALFILLLRPKIEINEPKIKENKGKDGRIRKSIQIPIRNISKISKATRIVIEVAIICNKKTYHLKTDFQDFAFIPKKKSGNDNVRVFNAYQASTFLKEFYELEFSDLLLLLNDANSMLRIRIHCTQSFSNLGETKESCFEYNNYENKFKPIK